MLKVYIVDDEFLARKLLQTYVEQDEGLELAGTSGNAAEAFAAIREAAREGHPVDVLLLDIHMPDLSGLELAQMLRPETSSEPTTERPVVIFTTAYSEYALQSYDLDAIDYLLKPIAPERFQQAIAKARRRLKHTDTKKESTFLMVKADYKMNKIEYDDLIYVEGQHEYVSFHLNGRRITALYSLKALEEALPADRFVRIHKSYIVSLRHITEVRAESLIVDGRRLPIGGNYREQLNRRLRLG